MNLYVNAEAGRDGDGSKDRPFCRISDAARVAAPGDVVLVAPGIYRENVAPLHAGREDARITYQSTEPLGAVITGAEPVKDWKKVSEHLYVTRIPNSTFGDYNPYTTYVYGDWFFAKRDKHTGCVWENDAALYEADSLEACERGDVSPYSWNPEASRKKWYTCQDPERDETLIYANFGGDNPAEERIEITVRRECFLPRENGISWITVSGFNINKAATTWAPPAAYQDGMIGPHWAKGWIIEEPGQRPLLHQTSCEEPDPDGAGCRVPGTVPRVAEGEGGKPHRPPLQHPPLRAGRHHRQNGRCLQHH